MWSEPLQMGEEAAPAAESFLLQSSDESFDQGGREEQKPFCSCWQRWSTQDEMSVRLSLFSCVAVSWRGLG